MKLSHKVGLIAAAYVWFKQGGFAKLPSIYQSLSNSTAAFTQELAEDPTATLGKAYTRMLASPSVAALLLYVLCRVLARYFNRRASAIRAQQQEQEAAATAAATSAPAAGTKKKKKK